MAELHAPSFASAAMNHWININSMVYSDIPHILVDIEAARMQMVIPGCQAGLASTWIIFHWKYEVVETFNFYVRFWYFVACEPATQLMRQGSNWCGVRLQQEGESVTVLTGGCWRPARGWGLSPLYLISTTSTKFDFKGLFAFSLFTLWFHPMFQVSSSRCWLPRGDCPIIRILNTEAAASRTENVNSEISRRQGQSFSFPFFINMIDA